MSHRVNDFRRGFNPTIGKHFWQKFHNGLQFSASNAGDGNGIIWGLGHCKNPAMIGVFRVAQLLSYRLGMF